MKSAIRHLALIAAWFATTSSLAQPASLERNAMTSSESIMDAVTFEFIETNGINMRLARAGESGPLVLMAHGWPESWYSWRHQILALANAGYRVVAPDMRGYGATDAPAAVEDYDINALTADMLGILDALNEPNAIMIGHDWGAIVAWQTVLRYPDRFPALIAMSVPYTGRSARSPMDMWRESFGDNFYYILYHNEAGGVAEAEYDADPEGLLSRLYLSPDSPRQAPQITDRHRSAGGWIGRLGAPLGLPDWLSQADLDYFVSQFRQAGFRGGVNYYRNFHRNWEIANEYGDQEIRVPTLFIAGSKDIVINGASAEQLTAAMSRVVADLRGVELIPDIGHWVQQEAPRRSNDLILEFLSELDLPR
jgi:pimeloyl-ACP methyl ester carboxylesterase